MQKTWVPEFTPNLQKFTKIYATFCAIYKKLRNLQCKLDLAPGPTPTFNRLAFGQQAPSVWVILMFLAVRLVVLPDSQRREGHWSI